MEDPTRRWKVSREFSNGWAVEVSTEGQFKSGAVKRLFATPEMMGNFPDEAPWLAKYDVTGDGQRFVFVRRLVR